MTFITEVVKDTAVLAHDIEITIENSALPNKQTGHIVPEGQPGFGGAWPKYIPRTEGDSRGPCPFLNSLANHGVNFLTGFLIVSLLTFIRNPTTQRP